MKIVLMTAEYGAGHDIGMQGIRDALEARGISYDLFDAVRQGSMLERKTATFYEFVMRRSHLLWQVAAPNILTASALARWFYTLLYRSKFRKELAALKPDIIVANHYICVLTAAMYKRYADPTVKIYASITEFRTHKLWYWPGVDCYFVASDAAKDELLRDHPAANVQDVGFPLRKSFWHLPSKTDARKMLELPEDKTILLLAAGSYNSVPVQSLVKAFQHNAKIFPVILAGRNPEAYEKYQQVLAHYHVTGKVYSFTNLVPEIMAASDLYISKSGAMSVGESLAAGLPAVYLASMPGDETAAAEYVEIRGAAINAQTAQRAIAETIKILESPDVLARMHQAARAIGRVTGSQAIVEQILNGQRV